jgi:acetyl-CoA carboxylase biotin carboxyl carrier protein
MDEFRLTQAELAGDGWRVALRKKAAPKPISSEAVVEDTFDHESVEAAMPQAPAAPKGMPVSSPMTGIYYGSPSPSAPPFVKEGDSVTAGEVVGLIEAMKVFNEIVAPTSGTITKIAVQSGQIVQPGDPLLYIG